MENQEKLKKAFVKRIQYSINQMENSHRYNPKILKSMINTHGTLDAVKILINNPKPSEGFIRLWELNALNLSLEAIIREEEWSSLFTDNEKLKAKEKLEQHGYKT